MKTIALITVILLFTALAGAAHDPEWQELKGEHFLVYFIQNKQFAQEVADKAEDYYRNIANKLGYPRYKEFWLWDKRVKIYIYPDRKAFLSVNTQPYWAEGSADYTNKCIFTHAESQSFLDSVLPHEITHLIFRDFIGFKGETPLWLDEGVAQWAEEAKKGRMKALAKALYNDDRLLTISDMMKLNMRLLQDKKGVFIRPIRTKTGQMTTMIVSTDNLVNTYYIQAVSIIDFLIERYGSKSFSDFCRELRDGKTTEAALKSAYPDYIHSLDELEDRWRRDLEEQM